MENLFEKTKFIMNRYGITANKNLGQNFLINEEVIDKIVDSSSIGKEDLVIEIGPGLGTLTEKLLESAGRVVAVELDTRMVRILEDQFGKFNNFEIINDDVLKINLDELITKQKEKYNLKCTKIVANLPYYITTPIVMKLLESKLDIQSITIMIQKEVADRLIAVPGDKLSGAITYSVYYYCTAEKVMIVDRSSFVPQPSVQSEVIKLKIRKEPPIPIQDKDLFFKVIKASFMQRRKTLINSLVNGGIFKNKQTAEMIFDNIGLDRNVRGENLTMQDFESICKELKKNLDFN